MSLTTLNGAFDQDEFVGLESVPSTFGATSRAFYDQTDQLNPINLARNIWTAHELKTSNKPDEQVRSRTFWQYVHDKWNGEDTSGTEFTVGEPIAIQDANEIGRDYDIKFDHYQIGGKVNKGLVDFLVSQKKDQLQKGLTIERGPGGWHNLGYVPVMLAAGMTDPINVGVSFVPIITPAQRLAMFSRFAGTGVNSARLAEILGNTPDVLRRAGVAMGPRYSGARYATRIAEGAIEGAVGNALLEPFIYGMATDLELNYTAADSFANIAAGAVIGPVFHTGVGFIKDRYEAVTFSQAHRRFQSVLKGSTDISENVIGWVKGGLGAFEDPNIKIPKGKVAIPQGQLESLILAANRATVTAWQQAALKATLKDQMPPIDVFMQAEPLQHDIFTYRNGKVQIPTFVTHEDFRTILNNTELGDVLELDARKFGDTPEDILDAYKQFYSGLRDFNIKEKVLSEEDFFERGNKTSQDGKTIYYEPGTSLAEIRHAIESAIDNIEGMTSSHYRYLPDDAVGPVRHRLFLEKLNEQYPERIPVERPTVEDLKETLRQSEQEIDADVSRETSIHVAENINSRKDVDLDSDLEETALAAEEALQSYQKFRREEAGVTETLLSKEELEAGSLEKIKGLEDTVKASQLELKLDLVEKLAPKKPELLPEEAKESGEQFTLDFNRVTEDQLIQADALKNLYSELGMDMVKRSLNDRRTKERYIFDTLIGLDPEVNITLYNRASASQRIIDILSGVIQPTKKKLKKLSEQGVEAKQEFLNSISLGLISPFRTVDDLSRILDVSLDDATRILDDAVFEGDVVRHENEWVPVYNPSVEQIVKSGLQDEYEARMVLDEIAARKELGLPENQKDTEVFGHEADTGRSPSRSGQVDETLREISARESSETLPPEAGVEQVETRKHVAHVIEQDRGTFYNFLTNGTGAPHSIEKIARVTGLNKNVVASLVNEALDHGWLRYAQDRRNKSRQHLIRTPQSKRQPIEIPERDTKPQYQMTGLKGFYSSVERVLDETSQKKMTGAQWKSHLDKKLIDLNKRTFGGAGLRAEEMKWTGMNIFLESRADNETFTRQELIDFARMNRMSHHMVEYTNHAPIGIDKLKHELDYDFSTFSAERTDFNTDEGKIRSERSSQVTIRFSDKVLGTYKTYEPVQEDGFEHLIIIPELTGNNPVSIYGKEIPQAILNKFGDGVTIPFGTLHREHLNRTGLHGYNEMFITFPSLEGSRPLEANNHTPFPDTDIILRMTDRKTPEGDLYLNIDELQREKGEVVSEHGNFGYYIKHEETSHDVIERIKDDLIDYDEQYERNHSNIISLLEEINVSIKRGEYEFSAEDMMNNGFFDLLQIRFFDFVAKASDNEKVDLVDILQSIDPSEHFEYSDIMLFKRLSNIVNKSDIKTKLEDIRSIAEKNDALQKHISALDEIVSGFDSEKSHGFLSDTPFLSSRWYEFGMKKALSFAVEQMVERDGKMVPKYKGIAWNRGSDNASVYGKVYDEGYIKVTYVPGSKNPFVVKSSVINQDGSTLNVKETMSMKTFAITFGKENSKILAEKVKENPSGGKIEFQPENFARKAFNKQYDVEMFEFFDKYTSQWGVNKRDFRSDAQHGDYWTRDVTLYEFNDELIKSVQDGQPMQYGRQGYRVKDTVNLDEIKQQIRTEIQEVLPEGIDIKYIDGKIDDLALGKADLEEGLIFISLQSPDILNTARHEMLEILKGMNLIPEGDWAHLVQSARKLGWLNTHNVEERWGQLEARYEYTPEQMQDLLVKEAIMEEYARWRETGEVSDERTLNIFQRIYEVLTRIYNKITGMGLTVDDIFERAATGQYKDRKAKRLERKKFNRLRNIFNYAIPSMETWDFDSGYKVDVEIEEGKVIGEKAWYMQLYQDGMKIGHTYVETRPDGGLEISDIMITPSERKKGHGKNFYEFIEEILQIKVQPSGMLLEGGYQFWKRKNPELVRGHQKNEGKWVSPRLIREQLDEIESILEDPMYWEKFKADAQKEWPRSWQEHMETHRQGLVDDRETLIKLWEKVPEDIKNEPRRFNELYQTDNKKAFEEFDRKLAQEIMPEMRKYVDAANMAAEKNQQLIDGLGKLTRCII